MFRAAVPVLVMLSCGSGATSPDAGPYEAGASDASGPTDAHADAHTALTPVGDAAPSSDVSAGADAQGSMAEGGACGTGPSSNCNQVANNGPVVSATCIAGAPPAMTGGVLADGTYVLKSATAYATSCAGASLPSGGPTTLVVVTGCIQSADVMGGAKTYTWKTTGNMLTMNEVCPGGGTFDIPYTATSTSLSELAPLSPGIQVVSVFQKQ